MRIEPDIIRDLLLFCEKHSSYHDPIILTEESVLGSPLGYLDFDVVLYHARQCGDAGFIEITSEESSLIIIDDLTYKGHDFLSNIRSDEVWNKTKEKTKVLPSVALDIISAVASEIVIKLIGL